MATVGTAAPSDGPGASGPSIRSAGGLVIIDKPPGWTSHDVVARCRKVFGLRQVGHAGTLDPDATGVLLVGVGPVTRLLRFLSGLTKSYTAQVVLGVATNTLDASGEVTGRWDMGAVSLSDARAAAVSLTGTIGQVPPMVSAVHVGGRRLHELARAGIDVERAARSVTVSRLDLVGPLASPFRQGVPPADQLAGGPVFGIRVDCSAGTYIRTLAADLGSILGGGAHLRHLRRTAVGPFTIEQATPLDALTPAALLPPIAALPGMTAVRVDAGLADAVGHGKVLAAAELGVDQSAPGPGPEPGPGPCLGAPAGPWAVVDASGSLLAVYQPHGDGRVKPVVVLTQPGS